MPSQHVSPTLWYPFIRHYCFLFGVLGCDLLSWPLAPKGFFLRWVRHIVRQNLGKFKEDLNFFSFLILVVHTISVKNPSDATLASLSISINPRWRPRWRPIIVKKCAIWKNVSNLFSFLNCLLWSWNLIEDTYLVAKSIQKNADKLAAKMAVDYTKYKTIFPKFQGFAYKRLILLILELLTSCL